MKSSREDSLDWLRSFQAPTSNLVLSSDSDSDSLPNDDQTPSRKKKIDVFEKHRGKKGVILPMMLRNQLMGCFHITEMILK
ncbi:hypothetical protein V6N13_108907 [Hibiscus sabdariffa]|uniref:Uncharacterized protein n=1 Tax=Hibiscus sabdariffa TaxID=183260 RepID=A0ABR2FN54_9ROSI